MSTKRKKSTKRAQSSLSRSRSDGPISPNFTTEIPKVTHVRSRKYESTLRELAAKPGKLGFLGEMSPGSASALLTSLKAAAQRVEGNFKFTTRTIGTDPKTTGVWAVANPD